MYYGKGFTHNDVYTLPTYLRKFYLQTLINTKEEENKEVKKANTRQGPSTRK